MSYEHYFASTPRGFEDLLAEEVTALGATDVRQSPGGAAFSGPLETGYNVCLGSRLAEHVLLRVHRFRADSADALYDGVRDVLWREHMRVSDTFAVDVTSRHPAFEHTHFAALRVKDAVVDQFREATGERPSVDLSRPDLRLHVHAARDAVTISIDLSGDALHRRGYRVRPLEAPIKETLAAGILMRAGWPGIQQRGGALIDPMCGSGTFLIEAAWMALNIAPSSLRERFGFRRWRKHDAALYRRLRERQWVNRRDGAGLVIEGYDNDPGAVAAARENVDRAGVGECIRLGKASVHELSPPKAAVPGLLVTNPPYGIRLTDSKAPEPVFRVLGERLKAAFSGWSAAVLVEENAPASALGLRTHRLHPVNNGPLRCRLLRYHIYPPAGKEAPARSGAAGDAPADADASAFANRVRKNLKTLGRWAKRNNISCYRIYDADVPEFAVAVDLYQSDERWVNVQEYEPPSSVNAGRASRRLRAALDTLPEVLDVSPRQVVLKRRRRQRGKDQVQRLKASEEFIVVEENGCRLLVNLKDRLDTGLYLDHRTTRAMIREHARGGSFLNLYAYTGAASVQAAAGGAASTLSIDMSSTYVAWGRRNFALNKLDNENHRFIRDDCCRWIQNADGPAFDLIFLDPPTFSNSKRMRGTLDIQRDHVSLITNTMRLLRPAGILLFSNHAKRFRMDKEAMSQFNIEDISKQTIPKDFLRRPNIHNCWRIKHRGV